MADQFSTRMKEYEAVSDVRLTRRLPVILRIDGNSFSKFTKRMKFEKPFDPLFAGAMRYATRRLLEYASGSVLGYTQSDEITLLLRNDQTVDTDPFLGNRLQKICSLMSATATAAFIKFLYDFKNEAHEVAFDCRVYIVPPSEVNNAFLWRQQDAFRNCCQAVAYYGLAEKYGRKTAQKKLHGLDNSGQQEIIFQELGVNMNDYPSAHKRGVCLRRVKTEIPIEKRIGEERARELGKSGEMVTRSDWDVDTDIPLFNEDTNYIEGLLA